MLKQLMSKIRSSLANRITFTVTLSLMIILGIVAVFSFNYIYSVAKQNLTRQTELLADSISKDVQNIFENANIVTEQMALNNELTRYLKEVKTRDDIKGHELFESVYQTLIDIQSSGDSLFLAWVANGEANFYVDSLGNISGSDYDVKKRPWYAVAIESEGTAFTPPYVEWQTRRVVISSIKALYDNNDVYGFVVVDIVLEDVPEILSRAKIGEFDQSFLITGDGTYVYHLEKEHILNSNYKDPDDPLSRYEEDIESAAGEFVEMNYKGRDYFLMSYPVGDQGWKAITLIDRRRIDDRIFLIAMGLVGIFMLGLMASIALIDIVVRRSMKPFRMIVEYGKDIAGGDHSRNMPEMYLNREDEMGEISSSFQTIVDTFRNENLTLEQKIAEKNSELEAQYKHILETEKAASLGNLVAGIAHEINTPIGTSLSTSTYLERMSHNLKLKYEIGEMTHTDFRDYLDIEAESLHILISSLERAAAQISSFKQVAVDQSSEMKYMFDLRESMEGVILSLRHEYKRTEHVIINNCSYGLEINSYPGAFGQVLTNLIMNSLKHGFKDIESGTIQIAAYQKDDRLIIEYTDNGSGMEKEVIERMYEPFFTTNRAEGNSGLGMHIVFNIVTQKLKGTIMCSSAAGRGVRFVIDVPMTI